MLICPSSRLLDASMKNTQNIANITSKAFQITNRNSSTQPAASGRALVVRVLCMCVRVSQHLILPEGKPLPLSLSRISLLRSGRDSLSVSRPSSWGKDNVDRVEKQRAGVKRKHDGTRRRKKTPVRGSLLWRVIHPDNMFCQHAFHYLLCNPTNLLSFDSAVNCPKAC